MEQMKSDSVQRGEMSGLRFIFRALKHRNYRLYFGGQSISLIGTWTQQVAVNWLVYSLTHSPLLLGVVAFSGRIPTFFLASVAGVLIDRWNRHRILVLTQILSMMQALILAFLVLAGAVAVWHLVLLSIWLGLVNAFDGPVRQAFVVEMIEKREDLGNAIALNSFIVNGARLFGPSIAGILIAFVGEGICFLVNGLSFIPVIWALAAMKITPRDSETKETRVWHGLKEGFAYAFGFVPIRSLLLLVGLVSLAGMPYTVLMPIFAGKILHGGPRALGFLLGATGIGALAGAVYLASRKSILGLGKVIVFASSIFGFGLIAFSLSRVFLLSLLLMPLIGFGMMVQLASSNTILQTLVDEDKRGRVMSLYTTAFMGMVPIGSLLSGSTASVIGAPYTVLAGGIICILASVAFARRLPAMRKIVRPIYASKGIIPEELP